METELETLVQDPKIIHSLPNEMLQAILDNLEGMELISSRAVCTLWKEVIEDICSEKRSLIIGGKDRESISELIQDYNGLVDLNKNCAVFKIEADNSTSIISLSNGFVNILTKLFSKIENLLFISPIDRTTGTANNLISLLNQWSSTIVTLNLSTIYEEDENDTTIALCDQIDKLESLKRLYFPDVDRLKPSTLARLEHCFFLKSYNVCQALPLLGSKFTSLYSYERVSIDSIRQWHQSNARLLNGLTHLGLKTHDHVAFPFVCANFGALQMLNIGFYDGIIFNADQIAHLARLSHLTELSIHGMKINLPTLVQTNLAISKSVEILTISIYNIWGIDENVTFSGDQFCRFLAKIFPNLKQLTIIYRDQLVREDISQHLYHLVHLRKHEIVAPY